MTLESFAHGVAGMQPRASNNCLAAARIAWRLLGERGARDTRTANESGRLPGSGPVPGGTGTWWPGELVRVPSSRDPFLEDFMRTSFRLGPDLLLFRNGWRLLFELLNPRVDITVVTVRLVAPRGVSVPFRCQGGVRALLRRRNFELVVLFLLLKLSDSLPRS